ncbi:polyprotein [Plakobranchus ocellatus]|uniref:Polyprotein n=1 Tax=Plakobranchus ocellatus TaxID=259542 RepID=A0AAV4DPS7_9GAST|nr:polyprotein [Plakobranchus ocellatus]
MEEANTYKREKYKDLSKELEKGRYKSQILPIEVGAMGFVGTSANNLLSKLSINGQKRTKALKALAEIAENSSRWIWGRRNEQLPPKNLVSPTMGSNLDTIVIAYGKMSPQYERKRKVVGSKPKKVGARRKKK